MLRYALYDIRASILSTDRFFFGVALPIVFFLLFGAMQEYASQPMGDGNVAAYVMIGMALYGAVQNTVAISGSTVTELSSGWNRQLALTPLTTGKYLGAKALTALVISALPVIAVNIVGMFTGVEIPLNQQLAAGALTVLCGLVFAFYGIMMGLLIRNENAVSIANGLLVIMSFFGTVFSPLSTDLLKYARFTPLYGAAEIARYPFAAGQTIILGGGEDWFVTEPLWYAVVSLAVWAAIFLGVSALLMRRATRR